jgi:hypothetical protein
MAQDGQNQHQPGTPDCPVLHRTVSGAPGWLRGKLAALENQPATWLKITGLSGGAPDCPVGLQRLRPSPSATNSSLSGEKEKASRLKITDCPVSQSRTCQRSAIESAGDVWPAPTVGWAHRTVQCANGTAGPTVGCAR